MHLLPGILYRPPTYEPSVIDKTYVQLYKRTRDTDKVHIYITVYNSNSWSRRPHTNDGDSCVAFFVFRGRRLSATQATPGNIASCMESQPFQWITGACGSKRKKLGLLEEDARRMA